jgi:hypothetical protein
MFKRFFFMFVMMAAVGVPYLVTSSSDWWNTLSARYLGGGTDGKAAAADGSKAGAPPQAGSPQGGAAKTDTVMRPLPVEGFGAQDLSQVLQFDGTPAWVMARWPRVTAGLAELDLQGYRVALVSGTADDDLAGSLTYYFDKSQRIARISFHGTTGDPRKLISLVSSRYHFVQQQTDDPSLSLFQVKWNGKPLSELRIRPARMLRADQPRSRYEVDLAMKRP